MGISGQKGFTSKTGDGVTAFEPLIENTYRNARPVMISANGAAYAAFLRADTSERVYAVVSKNSGSGWPAPVEAGSGDVVADAPVLLADGQGRIWLAYTRTGSSYDGNTMSSWAESQELVVGLVDPDTLSFTPGQVYSGMDYLHMHTLTLVNGTPTLVWLSSQVGNDNDVLWPVNNTIYTSVFSGTGWSNASAAGTADHVIMELAAGDESGALSIGYIMDTDNDYETADDRALARLANGQTQILSGSASAVTFGVLPGSNNSGFIWNEEGTLHGSDGTLVDTGLFTAEYRILGNSIYYSAATENGAELCLSRYENGTWSLPIFLTEGDGYLENISAARVSGTDYIMGMYTTAVIGKNTVEDSKDLVWTGVSSVSDLVIDGVEFDDSSLTAGQTVPVTLTVLNAGDHAVASADVLVNDQFIRTQAVNMDLGESGKIVVDLTVPSELQAFRLKVTETGTNDYRPDDNETELTLGCPDLTVELEWDHIGEKTQVVAIVRNNGVTPGAGRLYFADNSGTVLMEKVFGEITPGDRAIAVYDLDWSSIEENQIDVRAVVESYKDENVVDNNSDTLHLINAVPATSVSIHNSEGSDITGTTVTVNSSGFRLIAVAAPEGSLQSFSWSSSDTSVAEVDESGTVTFKKMGTVTITAVVLEGSEESAWVMLSFDSLQKPAIDSNKVLGYDKGITLTIERDNIVDGYGIAVYDVTNNNQKVTPTIDAPVNSGSTTKINIHGSSLVNGNVYKLVVYSYKGSGSAQIKSGTVSVYAVPNTQVKQTTAQPINAGVRVNSRHIAGTSGIRYYLYDSSTGKQVTKVTLEGENQSTVISDLENGKLYYVYSRPYTMYKDKYRWGPQSNKVYFVPVASPSGSSVIFTSSSTALISTSANSTADGVRVLYRPAGGDLKNGCEAAASGCSVSGLNNKSAYEFYLMRYKTLNGVKHYGAGITFQYNPLVLASMAAPQDAIVSYSGDTFTIKITKSDDADGISVLYRADEGDFVAGCESTSNTCSVVLDRTKLYTFYVMQFKVVNGKNTYSKGIVVKNVYGTKDAGGMDIYSVVPEDVDEDLIGPAIASLDVETQEEIRGMLNAETGYDPEMMNTGEFAAYPEQIDLNENETEEPDIEDDEYAQYDNADFIYIPADGSAPFYYTPADDFAPFHPKGADEIRDESGSEGISFYSFFGEEDREPAVPSFTNK